MTKQKFHHDRADDVLPMQINAFSNTHKNAVRSGMSVLKNKIKKSCQRGTHRQTCILHLTRSRGTTAVCVVPQLRIPPKPHRRKYFWDPNSQLSPSEEKQATLSIFFCLQLTIKGENWLKPLFVYCIQLNFYTTSRNDMFIYSDKKTKP